MDLLYMLFLSLLIHDYVKYNTYCDFKKLKQVSVTFVFIILRCPEEIQCLRSWILNSNPVISNKKNKSIYSIFSSSIFILHLKVNSRSLVLGLPLQLHHCSWWLGHIPTLFACWMCGEYPCKDNYFLCVWAPATIWVNFFVLFKKSKLSFPHFH